jgi:hypothetical protein
MKKTKQTAVHSSALEIIDPDLVLAGLVANIELLRLINPTLKVTPNTYLLGFILGLET